MASFREATELSPDFAPAWAGLADTLALETDLGLRPSDELATRARAFAARAMELDPTSPEAWTARGLVRLVFDLDVERAQSDVRRALHLAADEPVALQILSWLLSAQGRFAEAVAAAERASVLRPVAVSPRVDLAYMLYLSGRHEDAMRAAREALAIDERQTAAYSTLGWASVLAGRPREGYEAFRARVRNGSGDERELAALETSYEREGLRGLYRHWLASLRDAMGWTGRARLHAALGEVDEALACLERAVAARDSAVLWVAADPGFRPLSGDPRFVDLLARLRL